MKNENSRIRGSLKKSRVALRSDAAMINGRKDHLVSRSQKLNDLLSGAGRQSGNDKKSNAEIFEYVHFWHSKRSDLCCAEALASEDLSGACDAEHLFAKEPFQKENRLDILRSVASLPARCAHRMQMLLKFALPIPQSMDFNARNLAGSADADRLLAFLSSWVGHSDPYVSPLDSHSGALHR